MPLSYYIAALVCATLLVLGIVRVRSDWAYPYCAALLTIAAWYLAEPIYTPEQFVLFAESEISQAYISVTIFLVAFAAVVPYMITLLSPRRGSVGGAKLEDLRAETLAWPVIGLWLLLLAFGVYRLNGDLIGALFPVGSRSGVQMWSRAAGAQAGESGFIISAASYLYTLCLSAFGLLIFMVKSRKLQLLLIVMITISWPYAFFLGARSTFLAVVAPSVFGYVLFSRQSVLMKGITLAGVAAVLNLLLLLIIRYRNYGFDEVSITDAESAQHLGLNMGSELTYIVSFLKAGTVELSGPMRYIAEAVNLIPRAIWPDKPLLSIDYSIARGLAGGSQDIGVVATVSTGIIGQGVLSFGPFFGPIVAATLFSVWIGLLVRFWRQGTPPRLALFMVGLGLTFNLGRDLTLLVLWPIVFGYLAVRAMETYQKLRAPKPRRRPVTAQPEMRRNGRP